MKKILVIDDEQSICDIMESILTDEGFKPYTAQTKEQAFSLIEKIDFDIIFLDIWLPKINGLDLLKILRTEYNFTNPIIMISGHANVDLAVKAVEYDAYDFLEKPLTFEKITTVIANALETIASKEEDVKKESKSLSLEERKADFEKQCVKQALETYSNLNEAAKFLEITKTELEDLIKKYNI